MRRPTQAFGPQGWQPDRIPSLEGACYAVTGGNSGIGFEASRLLASRGARVVILCRDESKARDAVASIRSRDGAARIEYGLMDLSSLASVRRAADEVRSTCPAIDGLVLNAGIMMLPERELTEDGFETQLGVNHLGHFLLASLLYDQVAAADGRFVIVSSAAHRYGLKRIKFEDLDFDHDYGPTTAYAQSKLANMLFALELQRRLDEAGRPMKAIVCHPGWAATNLQTTGPEGMVSRLMSIGNVLLAESAEKGSWPLVLAATDPEARGAAYYGPRKLWEMRGAVDECGNAECGRDASAAHRLWEVSVELTGAVWKI